MNRKKAARRISPAWAKEDLEVSDKEVTLRGREQHDEMRHDPLIAAVDEYTTREQRNIHKLQNRALIGLALVLLEVLIIALVLVLGVANLWFSEGFAEFALASVVPCSVTAWMYVVRRTFSVAGK
jgi:hypothetical protein